MSSEFSESELIQQAVSGDRGALSQVLLVYYDEIRLHIAGRISQDLQGLVHADDVLQQTFVRVAQSIGGFEIRHPGAFRGWLKTIAENLLRDAEKRRRRERRARPDRAQHQAPGDDSSVAAAVERLAADGTTPGHRLQRHENIRCMRTALASLPDDQREIIERYYFQGQTLDQIAAATERTRDAVRGVCYRARKNLRALMGQSSLYFSG